MIWKESKILNSLEYQGIINFLERETGYTAEELESRNNRPNISAVRSLAHYLFYQSYPNYSLVGRIFKRSHRTIMYAENLIKNILETEDNDLINNGIRELNKKYTKNKGGVKFEKTEAFQNRPELETK